MENITDILGKYKQKKEEADKSKRPINNKWEIANEFGKYVGIPTPVVLRLFKLYGQSQTLSIRSWLFDIPHDPSKGGKIALAHWRLKELAKNKKEKGTTLPTT